MPNPVSESEELSVELPLEPCVYVLRIGTDNGCCMSNESLLCIHSVMTDTAWQLELGDNETLEFVWDLYEPGSHGQGYGMHTFYAREYVEAAISQYLHPVTAGVTRADGLTVWTQLLAVHLPSPA